MAVIETRLTLLQGYDGRSGIWGQFSVRALACPKCRVCEQGSAFWGHDVIEVAIHSANGGRGKNATSKPTITCFLGKNKSQSLYTNMR